MLRLLAAGVGLGLLSVVLYSGNPTIKAGENNAAIPEIEEIMKKLYKPKAIHKALGKALEEDTVKWDNVTKMTKEYADLAGCLPKNKCPKGSADSWVKLAKCCADDARALDTAAGKKDKAAAVAAWGKLNKSCQACHDEHR